MKTKTLLFSSCVLGPLFIAAPLLADETKIPPGADFGPNPTLVKAVKELIPTNHIATAKPWSVSGKPTAAEGLAVSAFAADLDHPRWIYVLPNGDVLIAETNGPERPDDSKGVKGFVKKQIAKKAGSATKSANRITLLRDADGDGEAETRKVFLKDLNSPFGMALVGDSLYVANTDAVLRFPYKSGDTEIAGAGTKVADLPAGSLNHHWTKSLIASKDGAHLYVGVGSNSNAGENGLEQEGDRARILEIDTATGQSRPYATGLRNPVGLAWEPKTGALWTAVNERDEIGSDLVPDYMTSVRRDAFYGWPYSYFGQHRDERVKNPDPKLIAQAIAPDYALGAHTASLGLAFNEHDLLPGKYQGGAFVGQHGSWNRKPFSGYKVIFVAFENGQPKGMPEDVLTGFLDSEENARGRPVGVAFDQKGALLVADDVGNVIWRVTPGKKREVARTVE